MFLFNIIVFGFKKQVEKYTNFLVKRGVATELFFMNLCFVIYEKLAFVWGAVFLANFG